MDIPRLVIVARYSNRKEIREELCCLSTRNGNTKGEDIAIVFIGHFAMRKIMKTIIISGSTENAPAMVGKQRGL